MCDTLGHNPWICHICGATSNGESTACSVCYKTTCAAHLKRTLLRNEESGLYDIAPVCVYCAVTAVVG